MTAVTIAESLRNWQSARESLCDSKGLARQGRAASRSGIATFPRPQGSARVSAAVPDGGPPGGAEGTAPRLAGHVAHVAVCFHGLGAIGYAALEGYQGLREGYGKRQARVGGGGAG